jgi:hypothetical protein
MRLLAAYGLLFLILSAAFDVEARTIRAASCSRNDVGDAVAAASDGDIVEVPPGTCTWNATLDITKGITLAGAGIDRTVILDAVTRALPSTGSVITVKTSLGKDWRITGFTFRDGGASVNWNGLIAAHGYSRAFRIDHIKFDDPNASAIRTRGDTRGVIDHSEFITRRNRQAIIVWHTNWGGVGNFGDNSWATPTELGSPNAVYIEDNVFTVEGVLLAVIDSMSGGRYVVRHNMFNNAAAGNHGTESSGRHRSARTFEVYNNVFTYPGKSGFAAVYLRGGTGVVFNNTCSGFTNCILAANYRTATSYSEWRKCDGTGPYDGNTGDPAGYPCVDQVGRGPGILLSGNVPSPVSWPQNAFEPVHIWGNILNGSRVASQHVHVQRGRDFIEAPKPGYKPFPYPHPLVSGEPAPIQLQAPTNLQVQ